jgi:hypothetical protein
VKEFSVFFVRIVQHTGMCISKTKTDKHKGEIKNKTAKEKQTKAKYVHNIQGLSSSEVSFQGLAIHRIGVRLLF